LIRSQVL